MILKSILTASLLAVTATPPDVIEMPEDSLFIELDLSKGQPLETLKEAVVEAKSEAGLFNLADISIADSTITVDHFTSENLMNLTNVSITLAYNDTDTAIGYSFTEQVTISVKPTAEPVILLAGHHIELELGESFNPTDYVLYAADGDRDNALYTIYGYVDTETEGTYEINYHMIGTDGTPVTETLTVDVLKPADSFSYAGVTIHHDGTVEAMFEAINVVRASYGLAPYEWAEEAAEAAQVRAIEAAGYVSHTRPNGTPYSTILDEYGIVTCHYPHEILVAYGNSVTVNLNWWLSEPGHAKIVLHPTLDKIAIGHYGSMWSAEVY